LSALVTPLVVRQQVIRQEVPVMTAVTLLVLACGTGAPPGGPGE